MRDLDRVLLAILRRRHPRHRWAVERQDSRGVGTGADRVAASSASTPRGNEKRGDG